RSVLREKVTNYVSLIINRLQYFGRKYLTFPHHLNNLIGRNIQLTYPWYYGSVPKLWFIISDDDFLVWLLVLSQGSDEP
ncbi:MAG: hypothetical protein K2K88_07775, partial [Muribaculaceae bacterium]|nr:hypothetical protein [Muribaculaceae bacterium]